MDPYEVDSRNHMFLGLINRTASYTHHASTPSQSYRNERSEERRTDNQWYNQCTFQQNCHCLFLFPPKFFPKHVPQKRQGGGELFVIAPLMVKPLGGSPLVEARPGGTRPSHGSSVVAQLWPGPLVAAAVLVGKIRDPGGGRCLDPIRQGRCRCGGWCDENCVGPMWGLRGFIMANSG